MKKHLTEVTKIYKITHKLTCEFYIGITKNTIGVDYFTSSKSISFSRETVNDWHIEILTESTDREYIWREEQRLIKENFNNPLNLNRHYRNEDEKAWDCDPKIAKKQWQDPEIRERRIKGINDAWLDLDKKAARIALIQAALDTPEMRARRSEIATELNSDPERKKRQSEIMKELYGPGSMQREIISKAQKERYKDPEERRKKGEETRTHWASLSQEEKDRRGRLIAEGRKRKREQRQKELDDSLCNLFDFG